MSALTVPKPLSGAARDVLWQLFRYGPTWAGDLASKSGRGDLLDLGYAQTGDGWSWLTEAGVLLALELGDGRKKESRR